MPWLIRACVRIRWKKIYGERDSYGQRSQIIKEFLTERKEFLDEVWIGQKELCTVHFIAEEYSRDTYMSVIEGEIGRASCRERV